MHVSQICIQCKWIFQKGQNTTTFMIELVQCNQPVPEHLAKWCHIKNSVLLSIAGRMGAWLWWVEVHVPEPMRDLDYCHHGQLVPGPMGLWWGAWKRLAGIHRACGSIHLIIENLLSAITPVKHSHEHRYIQGFFLPSESCLSIYLFSRLNCQQFSHHVPVKSLTIK